MENHLEEQLKKTIHNLNERIKELNCLHGLSEIIRAKDITLDEAIKQILYLIPPAMQYPESTCVKIIIGKQIFSTHNFKETEWNLSKNIIVNRKKMGSINIYYTEEKPKEFIGPFLKEEEKMLDILTEILARFIEQLRMEEKLNEQRQDLTEFVVEHGEDLSPSSSQKTEERKEWEIILDLLIKTSPQLLFRITRKMLYHLSKVQNESIENLMQTLSCPIPQDSDLSQWCGINMPNPRQNLETLKRVQEDVFKIARKNLLPNEISNLLTIWLRQDKARPLILASQKKGISLVDITDELNRFKDTLKDGLEISPEDDKSIRTSLLQRFFTDRIEYISIAKEYVEIRDFIDLIEKIIGPAQGAGKLGGKSSGIILAEKIIKKEMEKNKDLKNIHFAKSWYLTSDSMWDLIHYNALDEVAHIKYQEPEEIRHVQPYLEQIFKNANFSVEIIDGLRKILREIGEKPIIVRSSSLLEDSFGAAFSGKYKSLFLSNQGSEEEKLKALMDAIAEVYASTFAPDPIEYRREKELLDFNEEMGILIQEVVGNRIGPYYFPAFAGVAFSNNEFRWSPRIRREDGIIRLVMGLGTRAVDRVVDDYPVLISPNRPEIRVNALIDETIQYSQHNMDVINLEKGILETVKISNFLKKFGSEIKQLPLFISTYKDGHLYSPSPVLMDPKNDDLIVTFAGLFEKSQFLSNLKIILNILKEKIKTPVDVEFASDGERIYILQCRSQSQATKIGKVSIPMDISNDRKIFSANKYVTSGLTENIEYIVYVDPIGYESLPNRESMLNVARVVSELNNNLPKRKFILMGPGRWGSRGDIKLGVPVQYRDINNTSILIEIAREKEGYLPDLSFGTHFFQDLVEAQIHYLPLYPDNVGIIFNERLLNIAPNRVSEFSERGIVVEDVVRVIKISEISSGGTLTVAMDSETNDALAYLVPPDHWRWRMQKVEELASDLNADKLGVIGLYVIGSTKDATAGPISDIDLIVHFKGNNEQKEDLLAWFKEWSNRLDKENTERTGMETDNILDIHIITDKDILEKSSWAMHLESLNGSAHEIPLH